MSFEVRKARAADADELLITLEEARAFKYSQGDNAWGAVPFTAEEVAASIAKGTYIAEVCGQSAGSLILAWDDVPVWGPDKGADGRAGYIHRLNTRDFFRGQRIGQQIISWVGQQVQAADRSYIRLDCRPTNEKLCAYYEQQGFYRAGLIELEDHTAALYERPL